LGFESIPKKKQGEVIFCFILILSVRKYT